MLYYSITISFQLKKYTLLFQSTWIGFLQDVYFDLTLMTQSLRKSQACFKPVNYGVNFRYVYILLPQL